MSCQTRRIAARLAAAALAAPLMILAQSAVVSVKINVNPMQRFQSVDGFGVNFNATYFRDQQKPMIDLLVKDLGATIFRLDPYGNTNWEAKNDDADPNHMNLEYYNDRYSTGYFESSWKAARYLNSLGIKPFLTLSGITPEWMNDDVSRPVKHKVCSTPDELLKRGYNKPYHLNPAMYDEFAETVVSMLVYARQKAHVDFEYFSPVNETDCFPIEGPRIDPDEAPKVFDAVIKRMRAEGLGDVRLVIADQSNSANDYLTPILADEDLMKSVAVLSLHSYGNPAGAAGPSFAAIQSGKHPELRVWLTEYGDLGAADQSFENEWKKQSLLATRRALQALNEGARAALFWDAFDNYHEHDREMTHYGLIRNDDHRYSPKKRYYAAKQLYRFVPSGAQRVAATTDTDGLTVSAFHDGPTGRLIVVGVKEGGSDRVEIATGEGESRTWDVYLTTRELNCVKAGTVRSAGGVVRVQMPDEAVFTLVGTLEK
jgi:O-glycosyl hydrolase